MTTPATARRSLFRSISAKILLIQLISTLAIALTVGGMGYYGMSQMAMQMTSIYDDRVVPLQQLKTVSDAYFADIIGTSHKVANATVGWAEARSTIEDAKAAIDENWTAYLSTQMTPEELVLVEKVKTALADAAPKVDELEAILQSQNSVALNQFLATELYPATDPVDASVDELSSYQLVQAEALRIEGEALFNMLTWLVIGVALVVTLVAIAVVVVVTNNIKRNLSAAIALANAVAIGDVNATATVTSADEVRDLVDTLNMMTANLRGTAEVADQIANGDLTVDAQAAVGQGHAGHCAEADGRKAARSRRRRHLVPPTTSRPAARKCRPPPSSCAGRHRTGVVRRRGFRLDGRNGRQHQAERRQRRPDRKDRPPVGQGCRSLGRGRRHGGRPPCRPSPRRSGRAGNRPPDRLLGPQRRGGSRPCRRTWQGLCGRRLGSAQARRTQPGRSRRNLRPSPATRSRPPSRPATCWASWCPISSAPPNWSPKSPLPAASRMSAPPRSIPRSSSSTR